MKARTLKLLSLFFLPDPQALPISHCGCYGTGAGARGGSEGVSTAAQKLEDRAAIYQKGVAVNSCRAPCFYNDCVVVIVCCCYCCCCIITCTKLPTQHDNYDNFVL